jgi:DNA-binding MarR family transcriptional regulator
VVAVPTSSTPPDTLLRSAAFVVADLHRVGRVQLDTALADEGFTLRMHWILACLKQEGELTQRQVCDVLAVDRSDMVRLVDGLEKRGFVVRRKHAKDRRKQLLSLTEDGEKAVARTEELVDGATDTLFADLTAKDRRTLHRLALRALGHPKKFADTDA